MKLYDTRPIKLPLIILLALFTNQLFAQTAPNITYGLPQAYKVGTMIAPLGPTNTGGAGLVNGQTSTFVGNGHFGYADGTGTSASFDHIFGIAQDAQNNLYIADCYNDIIRKVTPGGVVTTFAGVAGQAGYVDGSGTSVRFNRPQGVAVDASGNVYVADQLNNMIRKITPLGVVSTLAGSLTAGSNNGVGTAAGFNQPSAMVADPYGNLYVADYGNNVIRKIAPDGTVSTYAGNGTAGFADGAAASAQFKHPYSLALDVNGNLYVSDRLNNRIRKIIPAGVVTTLAGSGAAAFSEGSGTAAIFNQPCGITIDQTGNLYVADVLNQRIRKVTQAGVVSTLAGTGAIGSTNATGDSSTFNNPYPVLADNDGGFVYVGSLDGLIRTVAISPYTISPDLPAGLSFDIMNGAITGTPEYTSPSTTYVVTEYNNTGKDTAHVTISVLAADAFTLSDQNYIATYTPRMTGITSNTLISNNNTNQSHEEISVQYFDGLGRPMQTVQVKGSPQSKDIVQPFIYDQFGREVTKYLPYRAATTNYGSYQATATSDDSVFYKAPPAGTGVSVISYPKASTGFEPSPLDRVVEQGAPGAPWQLSTSGISGSGHTIKTVYITNNGTSFASDSVNGRSVALYNVSINSNQSRTLIANGYYAANQLDVTISKDENWVSGRAGTSETYTDKQGHTVLKRTYNYTTAVQALSTYYVYDDLGNLAFVLPPTANGDAAATVSQTTLDNLCYQYRYDNRNRMSQQKLPGKGWEYTVYNIIDQPVATQDSLQRAGKNWTITKYDALGRVIISGIWNNGNTAVSQSSLQSTLSGITTNLWEKKDSTSTNGYSNVSWPVSAVTATLGINYYDTYAHIPNLPAAYTLTTGVSKLTKGLLTVKKTAVLNTPTDMLLGVTYYDDLGRTVTTYTQHYLGGTASTGNYDLGNITYNFSNAPLGTTRQHFTTASATTPLVSIANSYIYDHTGRKLMTWEQITNGNNVPTANTLVSKTDYNETGQVYKKHLHSTNWTSFLQDITYQYNERGWMVIDSSHLFAMQLYYNTGTNKAYNGNIMYQYWGVPASLSNRYAYSYDKLNRLLSGISYGNYNESNIAYDLEGNITRLTRTTGSSAFTDKLGYKYLIGTNPTNQLQSITDSTTSDVGLKHGTWNYTYDGNGNLLTDPSKGGTGITYGYNMLNLPQTLTGGKTITYTYDATGQKLRRVSTTTTGSTGKTDYINGIQYDDNNTGTEILSFIQTEEGKAVPNGSNYNYVYFLGDNLGNTRVNFDTQTGAAVSIQADNYYPFGMEQSVSANGTKNEYLYNKKELQEELGVYDYGARFYDPVIARWTSIDPHAEKYQALSPYNYVADNPLKYIDEDGRDIIVPKADRAAVTQYINSRAAGTFAINSKGHLYQVSSKGSPGFSTYYRDKLVEGIKSSNKITVAIGQTYTDKGNQKSVDVDAGGGVTISRTTTKTDPSTGKVTTERSADVIISGNPNTNIQDSNGKPLNDSPADILAHELVGHAIPRTGKSDTGNAVDNENKVRTELGPGNNAQRAKETKHIE